MTSFLSAHGLFRLSHVRSMLVAVVFRGVLEEQGTEQMEERPSWQKKLGVRAKQPERK